MMRKPKAASLSQSRSLLVGPGQAGPVRVRWPLSESHTSSANRSEWIFSSPQVYICSLTFEITQLIDSSTNTAVFYTFSKGIHGPHRRSVSISGAARGGGGADRDTRMPEFTPQFCQVSGHRYPATQPCCVACQQPEVQHGAGWLQL